MLPLLFALLVLDVEEHLSRCKVCVLRTVLMVLLLSLNEECFSTRTNSWLIGVSANTFCASLLTLSACLRNALFKIWTECFVISLDNGW